jgi:hypothetical protein
MPRLSNASVRIRWAAIGAAIGVSLGSLAVVSFAADPPGAPSSLVPITPCRLMDTRPSDLVGSRSTPIGPGETHTAAVWGSNGECSIPTTATGVSLNVTAVNGSASSFLTVFPSDAGRPRASSLNWVANQPPAPNGVTVKLSAVGALNLFNLTGTVDVIVDIVGYYQALPPAPTLPPTTIAPTTTIAPPPLQLHGTINLTAFNEEYAPVGGTPNTVTSFAAISWAAPRACTLSSVGRFFGDVTAGTATLRLIALFADGTLNFGKGATFAVQSTTLSGQSFSWSSFELAAGERFIIGMLSAGGLALTTPSTVNYTMTCT